MWMVRHHSEHLEEEDVKTESQPYFGSAVRP